MYKKIEDIAHINPDSIKKDFKFEQIEYIDISSVGTGLVEEKKTLFLSKAPSRAKRLVKDGDIILSTVRPNRRSFWFVKGSKKNTVVSTGFAVLRALDNIDNRYLYYAITAQRFTDYLTASAKGAAYPAVDTEIISRGKIRAPDIVIQKKIASVLSAYDDLIENNTRRIKILEEIAQMIYREWFVNFRFPGHENVRFVDSEMGKIPEGWEIKSIGEILKHHIGGGWGKEVEEGKYIIPAYVIRGTDIPSVKMTNINGCPLRYHTESNFKSRKIEDKDIIFEVSGGSKDQPVGRAVLTNEILLRSFNKSIICASFCKLIRVNNQIVSPEILYLKLLAMYEDRSICKYQVQSTGISNFKFEYFITNEKILIPSEDTRNKFAEIIEPIFKAIAVFGKKNMKLRESRDILIPKLITGEIDVSEMDIEIKEQEE